MKTLLIAFLALTLAACGHSSDGDASASSSSSTASTKTQDGPIKGPTAPLDTYTLLNGKPLWVAYAYYARAGESLTDEQKLEFFSPAYQQEYDAFKKRDLAKSELPKINEQLKFFADHRFFRIDTTVPSAGAHELDAYDFQTKSFPVKSCGKSNAGLVDGIQGVIFEAPELCTIKVEDEAKAKAIESVRNQYGLTLKVAFYIRIDGIDTNAKQLNATVTHIHTDVIDHAANSLLASSDVEF